MLCCSCISTAQSRKHHLLSGYDNEIKGYNQEALAEYKKAVEKEPDNDTAWTNLGNVYSKTGEKDKAIEAYKKAISINEKYPEAMNNLACIYIDNKENLDEAINLSEKSISLNPESIWCYYDTLGWAYFKKAEHEKALENINKAISLCPQTENEFLATAHYHSALIQFESGNKEDALNHYDKALRLSNDSTLKSIIEMNVKLLTRKPNKGGNDEKTNP